MEESFSLDPIDDPVDESEPAFKIEYTNTFGDVIRFSFYHHLREPTIIVAFVVFIVSISYLNFTFVPFITPHLSGSDRLVNFLFFGILNAIAIVVFATFVGLLMILSMASRKNRTFLTRHSITVTNKHLVDETEFEKTEFKWLGVQKLCRTRNFILIYVSQHAAHVIPRRAFPSPIEMAEFYDYCKSRFEESRDQ